MRLLLSEVYYFIIILLLFKVIFTMFLYKTYKHFAYLGFILYLAT